jgi:hypothetical protein
MQEAVKTPGMPSPEERPDLYDAYDCQDRPPLSEEYLNAVRPEHIKKAIADRAARKAADKGTDDL